MKMTDYYLYYYINYDYYGVLSRNTDIKKYPCNEHTSKIKDYMLFDM